jgi:O-antigen/teichoic acid export membrane protein
MQEVQRPGERDPARPRLRADAVRARRTRVDSVYVMALRVASLALNFLLLFVLARVMSLYQFGVTSTALALLNVVVIPATLGCDTAAIRYVALLRADRRGLRRLTRWLSVRVVAASLLMVLAAGVAAGVEYRLGHRSLADAIALLVPTIPTFALLRFAEGWLRGAGSVIRAQISSNIVIPGASMLLAAGAWLVARHPLPVTVVMGIRAVVGAAALALAALFIRRQVARLAFVDGAPVSLPPDRNRVIVGLAGASIVAVASTQVDILAVTGFLGARSGGIYSAAARVALAMNLAVISVNFGLAPRVARSAEDRPALQAMVKAAANFSAAIMCTGCLALMAAGSLVMAAFGPSFGPGATPLRILLLGQIVNGVCGPVGTVMNMSGRQRYTMWTQGAALAIQLALLGVLIPAFGLVGASIATATANVIWNLALALLVRRELGVWALPGAAGRSAAA